MLFERRRWARRIATEMGLEPRSRESACLVKLAIRAANRQAIEAREGLSRSLPKMDRVLFVGVRMHRNPVQVTKLMRKLGISQGEARDLLLRFARSAASLASHLGLLDIATVAERDGLVTDGGPPLVPAVVGRRRRPLSRLG